ncbi:hypothetical protein M433DRAFT_150052 [Acidomyces richmondensis BFW]|nr:MAG: hypothetical protein FE78DRAFT_88366 [Acidomyces sp. 'richmondensis']KYG49378.1 hypothetical protein M433DRAFT_150052 [Acidomyces richmondensis BFW]
MPGTLKNGAAERKRKLIDETYESGSRKVSKIPDKCDHVEAKILRLEEQILEGNQHLNNIVDLQGLVNDFGKTNKTATLAAVALCRIFCRMIAGGQLVKPSGTADAHAEIVRWLNSRLRDYTKCLASSWIGSVDDVRESAAVTLLMKIVKQDASTGTKRSDQAWRIPTAGFCALIFALIEKRDAGGARKEFVEKYVEKYDDVRFYTFLAVTQYLKLNADKLNDEKLSNTIELLANIEGIPEKQDQLKSWYGESPNNQSKQLRSLNAHRKTAQEAWLAIFRSGIKKEHRKHVINIASSHILPWFANRIELLTDFLTDTFNEGGSLSLLALSSIFQLMTQHNLDYPEFYTKLYSLLDEDVLHNKHRGHFFRLLNQFMSSSHLPAAMIASFIKKLARLSLQAPPGAIVWIVPWVYNMLKMHPACTFMLHRPYHPAHAIYSCNIDFTKNGMLNDTFSILERDPSHTGAIESSLWELETLQSHYHPNVATLARIMSEQFTKREYQLEDFLDHSYATVLDAEFRKDVKKSPVVEWEIPKQILTAGEGEHRGLSSLGSMLETVIKANNAAAGS